MAQRREPRRGWGRALLASAACALAGCASGGVVHARQIAFFPGPADATLQAQSYDAVSRVLRLDGSTIIHADAPAALEAVAAMPCDDELVASFRFARTDDVQTIAVRLCRPDGRGGVIDCDEHIRDVHDASGCQAKADELFSSIERDLANTLLGKTEPAEPAAAGAPSIAIASVLFMARTPTDVVRERFAAAEASALTTGFASASSGAALVAGRGGASLPAPGARSSALVRAGRR